MPTNHGLFWLFLHEFEVGDFIGIVVLGFDADDVGGGGEVGDVEVVGACEGGHGASVHVHDEDFKDFVGGADDGDFASGGIWL